MAVDGVGCDEGSRSHGVKRTVKGKGVGVVAQTKGRGKLKAKSTAKSATKSTANATRKMKTKKPRLPRPRKKSSLPLNSTPASMSTSTSTSTAQAAAGDVERSLELQQTLHLLDRLFHRNRNQHRGQHWWKFLTLLRRGVRELCEVVEQLGMLRADAAGGMGTAEAVRKRFEREERLERRKGEVEGWVRETVVPRAYVAFSAVVADGSFCALGLVLLGVLGGVVKVLGCPREAGEAVEFVGRRVRQTGEGRGPVGERSYKTDMERMKGEDVGVVVERRERKKSQGEAGLEKSESLAPGGDELLQTGRKETKSAVKDSNIPPDLSTNHPPPSSAPERFEQNTDRRKKKKDPNAEPTSKSGLQSPRPTLGSKPSPPQVEASKKTSKTKEETTAVVDSPVSQPEPRKKKKRKKGNAMDDLFADLV